MESEDISEQIEWEARRIAAAFDIEDQPVGKCCPLKIREAHSGQEHLLEGVEYRGSWNGVVVRWIFIKEPAVLQGLSIGFTAAKVRECCTVFHLPALSTDGSLIWSPWDCLANSHFVPKSIYREQMMRGLYRLGLSKESGFEKLNHPLSAHEKLELRLSMPREFWPQTWLKEEAD